jgi:hypothetical protein
LFWIIWALIPNFRLVLNVAFFLLDDSPVSKFIHRGITQKKEYNLSFVSSYEDDSQHTQKIVTVALFFSLFCFCFRAPILHHNFITYSLFLLNHQHSHYQLLLLLFFASYFTTITTFLFFILRLLLLPLLP